MANNLNFKYGLYERLASQPVTNGNVYVTTDERSMYVDLDNKRIRLQGSVMYYESVESFTTETKPPYSTDTLYFFRNMGGELVNALMAYDGQKWVQINISAEGFAALQQKVEDINGNVTELSSSLNALTQKHNALEGTVNGHTTTLAEYKKLIDANKAQINKNTPAIAANAEKIKTNTAAIQEAKDSITSLNSTVGQHTTTINKHTNDIEANKTAIGNNATAITKLQEKDSTMESQIGANADAISKLQEKTTTHDSAISDLNSTVQVHTTDITGLKTRVGNVEQKVGAVETKAKSLETRIGAAESDINNLQTADTNLGNRVKAVEDDLKNRATTAALNSAVSTINDKISANTTKIDKNTADIAEINKLLGTGDGEEEGTSITDKITALEAADVEINKAIQNINNTIADPIQTTLNSHTSKITNLENRMGTAEGNINTVTGTANKNKTDLAALAQRVTTAEGKITTVTNGLETANNAIKEIKSTYATNTSVDTKVNKVRTDLTSEINQHILSANAMEYQGTIETKAALTSKKAKIGYTYILSKNDSAAKAAAGDMFIATGTEGSDGFIPAGSVVWNHVKTGYDSTLNPTLTLAQSDSGASATVTLNTYAGSNIGGFSLKSGNPNLKIVTDTSQRSITITSEWGTF